ncbi:MAG: hypothetical protein AAF206_01775 [Bacteroidota bacterium]
MKESHKLSHPVFILSVILLILNDWVFKAAFHNALTGKLSDFAGLFAFPFLFSILFPNHKKAIHLGTVVLFIFWNSELSQPMIDGLNAIGSAVGRTIDPGDFIALVSVYLSYRCLKHSPSFRFEPFVRKTLIGISFLAFFATTLPPLEYREYIDVNKQYEFDFSKRELVSRLNMVQLKEIRKLGGHVDFDADKDVFHFLGRTDTLAYLLDPNKISDQDTIEFKTSFAKIMISGSDTTSALKLLTVYKLAYVHKEKDYREKAIRQFEKWIVKKIRKF